MPRPENKHDLIEAASTQFKRLGVLVDGFPPHLLDEHFIPVDSAWNARDTIAHLYEWHRLLLRWVRENTAGNSSPFLPPPHTFKDLSALNDEFWHRHQGTEFVDAWSRLEHSHADVMNLVQSLSEQELFTKKFFNWTGSTSLGAYCNSVTSSHYEWAIKFLRKLSREVASTGSSS